MARVAALAAALACLSACHSGNAPHPEASAVAPRIELNVASSEATVDVVGLPRDDLAALQRSTLSPDEWTALLRIAVASGDRADPDRPAVLGRYAVRDGRLRFTPQFSLDRGQRYLVSFDPARLPAATSGAAAPWRSRPLSTSIQLPRSTNQPPTRIVGVFPSAGEVPENQLRMYIAFSAPMGLGGGVQHVHLLEQDGRPVADPFLPLDVDLWNEDRTRFTVLFDPGRVKRGILPNEQMGRSLVAGRKYTLVVDEGWHDGNGQPLAEPFRRDFTVGAPQEQAIDPARWRIEAPTEGTQDAVVVSFPKPLDYGLLQRALTVVGPRGERVAGDVRLEAAETRWVFTPRSSWQAGDYRLLASSILEDVAGNRIGRPFEVDDLNRASTTSEARSAALRFRVVSSKR